MFTPLKADYPQLKADYPPFGQKKWDYEVQAIKTEVDEIIETSGCGGTTLDYIERKLTQYKSKTIRIAVYMNYDTYRDKKINTYCTTVYVQKLERKAS